MFDNNYKNSLEIPVHGIGREFPSGINPLYPVFPNPEKVTTILIHIVELYSVHRRNPPKQVTRLFTIANNTAE